MLHLRWLQCKCIELQSVLLFYMRVGQVEDLIEGSVWVHPCIPFVMDHKRNLLSTWRSSTTVIFSKVAMQEDHSFWAAVLVNRLMNSLCPITDLQNLHGQTLLAIVALLQTCVVSCS